MLKRLPKPGLIKLFPHKNNRRIVSGGKTLLLSGQMDLWADFGLLIQTFSQLFLLSELAILKWAQKSFWIYKRSPLSWRHYEVRQLFVELDKRVCWGDVLT